MIKSILIEISDILKSNVRDLDILGRWGGEEFMIICPDTNRKNAYVLSEKLRKIVENYNFQGVGYKTCSFGVSEFMLDDTPKELIKRADEALYRAKNSARNRVILN